MHSNFSANSHPLKRMHSSIRKFFSLSPVFYSFYFFGLVIAVPLSLTIWFVRRELFVERSVAGGSQNVSCLANYVKHPITRLTIKFFKCGKKEYPESRGIRRKFLLMIRISVAQCGTQTRNSEQQKTDIP